MTKKNSKGYAQLLPNYRRQILEKIPGEWYHFAKRTDIPPLPVWEKMLALGSQEFKSLYSTTIPGLAVWDGPYGIFYWRSAEYRSAVETVTRLLLTRSVRAYERKVLYFCDKAKSTAKHFRDPSITKWSNARLLKFYEQTIEFYNRAFFYGFITWCAQIVQEIAIEALRKRRQVLSSLGIDQSTAFAALVKSPQHSLYAKKSMSIHQLSKRYRSKLISRDHWNEGIIKTRIPALHHAVKKFLQQYAWVGYDYGGPLMTYGEVVELIRTERADEKRVSKTKFVSACEFDAAELKIFDIFASLSHIKDMRNAADDYVHWCLDLYFAEVGRRYGLEGKEVRYLWPDELRKLLKGEESYAKDYLKQKMAFCSADMCMRGEMYAYGAKARSHAGELFADGGGQNETVIRGTSAAAGLVRGTARIVHTLSDMEKVKEGDILITHMTSPRFMVAIIRCAAIVTDEGGLTSHAAIVARELQKACVVGTRNATTLIKDGDFIEVDAEKGIVRRL